MGIEVRAVPTASDKLWGYAEVRLSDARYAEVYESLADDLVGHVSSANASSPAIDRLVDRIRRWEAFLKIVGPEGLGPERRAGLFGELHVMREHLLPLSTRLGVNAWVGPSGAQQDFQASTWALEVKTSRVKLPISVRISGERQLDDAGLMFLGLAHVGLEQRQGSGETLPQIVASVRSLLATSPTSESFEARLLEAGYHAVHEHLYVRDGYTVRFDQLFQVTTDFPRIIETDLSEGIGDVSYSIAIASLTGFGADWRDLETHIRAAVT